MKKILIIFVVICSLFLVCCAKDNKDELIEGIAIYDISNDTNNIYPVTVKGLTEFLVEPLEKEYKAGTEVVVKVHPITDVGIYVFMNNTKVPKVNFDSDYWEYQFVMPECATTIAITTDRFYGKTEANFSDLYSWVPGLSVDNVDKIVVTYNKNVGGLCFIRIETSIDFEDKTNFLAILNEKLEIYKPDTEINVSSSTSITFYSNNRQYGIGFKDNLLFWSDGDFGPTKYFKIKKDGFNIPLIENLESVCFRFEYDGLSSDIKKLSDDSFVDRFYHINVITFIPYTGSETFGEAKYYLDSRYGKIELISEDIFKLNDEYYKILSGSEYWAYQVIKQK